VRGWDTMWSRHAQFTEAGYEGSILRDLRTTYQHKRTPALLKVKEFMDAEYQLVAVEEGKGNRAGLATRAVLLLKDGRQFEAGVMGDDAYARKLLGISLPKTKYVFATVKHQGFTPKGVPRFGKLKVIRDYE
jgi:hypothetical protein